MKENDCLRIANEAFRQDNYFKAKMLYQKCLINCNPALKFIIEANIELCNFKLDMSEENSGDKPSTFYDYYQQLLSFDTNLATYESIIESQVAEYKALKPAPMVSIVMPTWNRGDIILEAIYSILNQSYTNWELLVCDDGSTDDTQAKVSTTHDERIKYFRLEKNNGAVARNHGITKSGGDIIAFLDSDNIWHPDYLKLVVTAHNLQKSPVVYTGFYDVKVENSVITSANVKFKKFNYLEMAWRNFIDLNTVSIHRALFNEVGVFDPILERQQDWDLLIRCGQQHPFYGLNLPLVLYRRNSDWNQVTRTKKHLNTRSIVLQKNNTLIKSYSVKNAKSNNIRFFKNLSELDKVYKNKIAIKISAPSKTEAYSWGDYHFANQLGKAFYKLGWEYEVHCQDEWYTDTGADINLVLRGRHRFVTAKSRATTNLLWIISHPDRIASGELEDYNHIFVASETYVHKVRSSTQVPASILHQATDPAVFKPCDNKINLPSDVVFIGNSRKELRTMVKWSVQKDIPIAVWGKDWKEFISTELIQGEYIPNDKVATYYTSSKILLNDHWDSMKNNGFISNRIFDVSAAGGFIITDDVKGLANVFGDSIVVAKSATQLKQLVEVYLLDKDARYSKVNKARNIVLENHTFDHRAGSINNIIRKEFG